MALVCISPLGITLTGPNSHFLCFRPSINTINATVAITHQQKKPERPAVRTEVQTVIAIEDETLFCLVALV